MEFVFRDALFVGVGEMNGAGAEHERLAPGGRELGNVGREGNDGSGKTIETFEADDTTGAGDTFLGGFLAAWRAGEVERAVESGVAAAGALLLRRTKKNMGETGVR